MFVSTAKMAKPIELLTGW